MPQSSCAACGLTARCLRRCRRPFALVDDSRIAPPRAAPGRVMHVDEILVTTSDGELIGPLFLSDAEHRLTQLGELPRDAESDGA